MTDEIEEEKSHLSSWRGILIDTTSEEDSKWPEDVTERLVRIEEKLGQILSVLNPKKYTVTVQQIGDELFIPLPEEMLERLGLKAGDTLSIELINGRILLTPDRHET